MSRKKTTTRLLSTSPLRSFLLIGGLALFIALSWRALFPGTELGTSVLRTSFNRLSSTVVNFSIPSAGTLSISAGPSAYIGDARVFGLILELENANPTNSSPFIIQSPDLDVFNTINPDNPQEVILTTIFPQGHLTSNERLIAELPFSPTQEGQFLIKSIFFGNLPATTFPAYQEFPIFIESSNILFDANGNAVVVTPPPPPPPPPVLTQCSDGLDNDADGLTDYSADPGCEDLLDNDETDPIGLGPLRLDIPPDLVKVLQKLNHTIEHLVILPPAQQFLQYQFQMEAAGGEEPLDYTWSRVGGALNTNNQYDLPGSGLTLSPAGLIQAAGPELNPGNYQYQLSVSDGLDTLEFSLQIAVYDGFGNPILLQLVPSFTGSEQICTVGQICEASFLTREGRSPYTYTFTGEKPDLPTFPQMSIDGPFYRFTPTTAELGSYRGTMSVSDSSVPAQTAQRDFMLTIVPADIESEFVYSAEKRCDFLDISAVEEAGQY
ncbi:MAG: hypothetical protein U1C97_00070, partial [Candidatus Gracilibacteria bacterium]|nr:hypothetical protein [Candidatus Gracilibacteria bacterium]